MGTSYEHRKVNTQRQVLLPLANRGVGAEFVMLYIAGFILVPLT